MFWNMTMYFSVMIDVSVAAPAGARMILPCHFVGVAHEARSRFRSARAAPALPVANSASALINRFSLNVT